MKQILLAFVPIFVAVDAIGVLPIFINLTKEFGVNEKRRIVFQSVWTAISVAFVFILVGKSLWHLFLF